MPRAQAEIWGLSMRFAIAQYLNCANNYATRTSPIYFCFQAHNHKGVVQGTAHTVVCFVALIGL